MKRFLALAVALLIAFSFPVHVYSSSGFSFYVGSLGSVRRGDSITVPINVSSNPGFTAVGLVLNYNPSVLTITGVTAANSAMPLNTQFALTSTAGTQWISMLNQGLANWNGNGTVANVTFNVNSNAPAGTSSLTLTFTTTPNGAPADSAGTILSANVIAGNVNVIVDNESNTNTGGAGTGTSGSNNTSGNTGSGSVGSNNPSFNSPNANYLTPGAGTSNAPPTISIPLPGNDSFIGIPYTPLVPSGPLNTSTTSTATPAPDSGSNRPSGTTGFGTVPQTGVGIDSVLLLAFFSCLSVSVILWGFILFRKFTK
jgi:hypothetical protein